MSTLLSDYQFCQMENELLRNQAKTLKMDINSMSKELTEFFKEKEFIIFKIMMMMMKIGLNTTFMTNFHKVKKFKIMNKKVLTVW